MYNSADLRKGLKIEVDQQPWSIVEMDFCKPGKGTALYRCKLKNLINGSTLDRTFRPNDKFDKPNLEEKECVYSYHDGDKYVFNDNDTFEELYVNADVLGNQLYFLIENTECKILYYNHVPIEVTLPVFVEKTIIETEPAVRGDTANNVTKSAKIDNGYEIQVPLFLNIGDRVKIDTRTGSYAERISKG